MKSDGSVSRRSFLALSGAASLALAAPAGKHLPIGLELYSVRGELARDLNGTVTAVAKMGYEVVEFYAPYFSWTTDQAKDVRKLLDDLGIKCNSTHNSSNVFVADGLQKAIELNQILGTKYVVWASATRPASTAAGSRSIPSSRPPGVILCRIWRAWPACPRVQSIATAPRWG